MRPLSFIPRYTVEDYNLWEGDWELIDGIPHAMSPSPNRLHQLIQAELVRQLGNSLQEKKNQCGDCSVVSDLDWVIERPTVVRPDVAIICKETGNYITSAPRLIIEILSPSTALKDRHVKFDMYQELGVKYYIIIDPITKKFTAHELNSGQYTELDGTTSFIIHDDCSVQLDIAQALAELA